MTTPLDTTSTVPALSVPTFTASRAALADALATVGLGISTRPAVPILGAVLLEGHPDGCLTLSGFDHETAITVTIDDAATISGRVLIDHAEAVRVLTALVKGKSKRAGAVPVTIAAPTPDAPTMTANGYTVPLTAYPLADYPTLPEAPPTVATVDREHFTAEAKRVLSAVGDDDALPMLTGINMEMTGSGVRLAATDRYRLAVAHLPALSGEATVTGSALVRGELVGALTKRFTGEHVTVGRCDGVVSLSSGTVTAVTRPIDGEFIKYNKLISHASADSPASFAAERADLIALTDRAKALLMAKREGNKNIGITIAPGSLTVAPLLSERADELTAPELVAKTEGYPDEPIRFAFASTFLADALAGIAGPTVTVHTQLIPTKPVVLTEAGQHPDDDTAYRHLLMPVRIS